MIGGELPYLDFLPYPGASVFWRGAVRTDLRWPRHQPLAAKVRHFGGLRCSSKYWFSAASLAAIFSDFVASLRPFWSTLRYGSSGYRQLTYDGTQAEKIDIIAHSMGVTLARKAIKGGTVSGVRWCTCVLQFTNGRLVEIRCDSDASGGRVMQPRRAHLGQGRRPRRHLRRQLRHVHVPDGRAQRDAGVRTGSVPCFLRFTKARLVKIAYKFKCCRPVMLRARAATRTPRWLRVWRPRPRAMGR